MTVYYTPVGSYDGTVKVKGRWTRVTELNRIDKRDWKRWQGPPSPAIIRALRETPAGCADYLYPEFRGAARWRSGGAAERVTTDEDNLEAGGGGSCVAP